VAISAIKFSNPGSYLLSGMADTGLRAHRRKALSQAFTASGMRSAVLLIFDRSKKCLNQFTPAYGHMDEQEPLVRPTRHSIRHGVSNGMENEARLTNLIQSRGG
jgi:hypothetical protein